MEKTTQSAKDDCVACIINTFLSRLPISACGWGVGTGYVNVNNFVCLGPVRLAVNAFRVFEKALVSCDALSKKFTGGSAYPAARRKVQHVSFEETA